ncbi:MAG TPA: hypothetical protein VEL74_18775 [Thermoanaerobaculia bacterium]|nr:hypothetical protein [Thermoanaerobaculia bacterium]
MSDGTKKDGELEKVRSELRRLGYLDHGFERFLLQDALRPQRPLRTLTQLTLKVGLLAGGALAFALALALAVANDTLSGGPWWAALLDLGALFLHLFPPVAATTALAFLALCGLILLAIRLYHVRRIETLSLAAAVAAGAAGLWLALWSARTVLPESGLPQLLLLGLVTPVAIYALVKLVYHGLLTLAIRFTDAPPRGRLFSGRWLGLAILSAAFILTLPAVLSARRVELRTPATLPMAPGDRVLLLGIDGVLPEEVDYLLSLGDLPTLGRLAGPPGAPGAPGDNGGGRVWSYRRRVEPPASFWTSVATGRPGPDHGVSALDSFRPLGVRTPLERSGPLRLWWSRVAVPLGIAEYRPVLANRRRAFTLWELASRGGAPVLAVNWWATFPAETLPGQVVAHGAYQLLAEGVEGAVAPDTGLDRLAALAAEIGRAPWTGRPVTAALPPKAAAAVLDRALRPDLFYREAFLRGLHASAPGASPSAMAPRAAALYLPGLDIAADGWSGGAVAFADLVREELVAADGVLARALAAGTAGAPGDEVGTIAVVFDPGRRREGGEGRILLWRRAGCSGAAGGAGDAGARRPETSPEAVAAALLRAAGLPQSAELPAPPAGCPWPDPPVTFPGYGEPRRTQTLPTEGGEYLESLRSLGYL